MFGTMPIGHYVPVRSVVHRLDPRTKILSVIAVTVAAFAVSRPLGYALLLTLLLATSWASRVGVHLLLRAIKPMAWVLGLTFVLNVLFMGEGRVLLRVGPLAITHGGLHQGLAMLARLTALIGASSLLTMTTSPIELTDGLERLLAPLRRLGFPAHEFAMMMSIALRFVPTLLEEAQRIAAAQASRGADLVTGGMLGRVRTIISLMVPLFVSSFRRADELATAMEARMYRGGSGRTRLRVLRLGLVDVAGVAVVAAVVIGAARLG